MCWVATECSWNDGSKTQYYVVILNRLQDRSGGLERAPESWIRGPLTLTDEVAEPHLLWDQFKTGLCDDVKHKLHHMNHYQANQEDDVYDYGLWDLNRILVGIKRSLVDFLPIPLPQQ